MESKLYWVSVGGNSCEPARIVDGMIYTIGCCDGTKIEDGCGIELVKEINKNDIPNTPKERKRLELEWEQNRKLEQQAHRYKSFN